jgi:hypothetical protein
MRPGLSVIHAALYFPSGVAMESREFYPAQNRFSGNRAAEVHLAHDGWTARAERTLASASATTAHPYTPSARSGRCGAIVSTR